MGSPGTGAAPLTYSLCNLLMDLHRAPSSTRQVVLGSFDLGRDGTLLVRVSERAETVSWLAELTDPGPVIPRG